MRFNDRLSTATFTIVLSLAFASSDAADWPAWRHDVERTGVTSETVPTELKLRWSRQLPVNHVAWAEDTRLQFDVGHKPVVVGKQIVVASSQDNSVRAFDTESGSESWIHLAEAPVRLAPFIHNDSVYFGADDGKLHCLDLASGKKRWSLMAAPNDRLVLGNERLISVWPNRGGVAIWENHAYFTVGVWPFEGSLLCKVDLSQSSPKLQTKLMTDVSPQGYLAIVDGRILVPGGRGLATAYDAKTLEPISLSYGCSRGMTETYLTAGDQLFFHGDAIYSFGLRQQLDLRLKRPLYDAGRVLSFRKRIEAADSSATAAADKAVFEYVSHDVANLELKEVVDRRGRKVKKYSVSEPLSVRIDPFEVTDTLPSVQIKAADQLFAVWNNFVFSIPATPDRAEQSDAVEATWHHQFNSQPTSIVAADGKLFVATLDGGLHCFGSAKADHSNHPLETTEITKNEAWAADVQAALQAAGTDRGHCIVLGSFSGQLVTEVLRQSQFEVHIIESDAAKADQLRRQLQKYGVHGNRASVHTGQISSLPPYMAHLILSENIGELGPTKKTLSDVYHRLRPYGGTLVVRTTAPTVDAAKEIADLLPGAAIKQSNGALQIKRVGALAGAADWTHEYGDSSNTLMSRDSLVRAPLGVLWFGGPASHGDLYFNRHYWGPGLTVIDGRMVVQGPQFLSSIDIYTGQILWRQPMRGGSGAGRRGNFFEVENPGYHFTVTSDAVYLMYPEVCLVLDPLTGGVKNRLRLPNENDLWGKVRLWKDRLIVAVFRQTAQGEMPKAICALDRHTGEQIWRKQANNSMPLIAVGGDRVYCFDGFLPGFYDAWKRRGKTPPGIGPRVLRAFDAATGEESWQVSADRVATWMAYSPEHDTLVVSNKQGVDAISGKDGKVLWAKGNEAPGFGGHPENVWDKVIISGDRIIDQRGPGMSYDLKTGKPIMCQNPISLEAEPWQFTKTGHHCNYAIASPHLLTFRAGTAGFFDRSTNTTSRLNGFRSGCRNSLIPAGGVLNAPNYAHGCSCNYNLFTSLALVHMPDGDLWSYNAYASPKSSVARVGVNFNAPGDRIADDGTLWLEYPATSDPSPTVQVDVKGDVEPFRFHTRQVQGERPWIGGSGLEGIQAVSLRLPATNKEKRYSLKLYFLEPASEPADADQRERAFDIKLQGRLVREDFRPQRAAGEPMRTTVQQFDELVIDGMLQVELVNIVGKTVLSGLELTETTQGAE